MSCTIAVILTGVQPLGGAALTYVPLPGWVGHMTVAVAAVLVGISPKTIRNDLAEFRDKFDTPSYQRGPGSQWGRRLISARDLETLRGMYPRLSSYKR